MTGFEFDTGSTPGTNRSAAVTDCDLCGGDRMVLVDAGHDVYARCPRCNPNPQADREPVAENAWWKE